MSSTDRARARSPCGARLRASRLKGILGTLVVAAAVLLGADARADAFLFGGSASEFQTLEIVTGEGTFTVRTDMYGAIRDDGRSQRGYGVGRIDAIGHTYRNVFIFDMSEVRERLSDLASLHVLRASVTIENGPAGYSGPDTSIFTAWYPGFHAPSRFQVSYPAGDPIGLSLFEQMSGGQALQRVEVGPINNVTGVVAFDLNDGVLPLVESAIRDPRFDGTFMHFSFIFSGSLNEDLPEPGTFTLVSGAALLLCLSAAHRRRRGVGRARRAALASALLASIAAQSSAASLWTVFEPIEDATQIGCSNLCWVAGTANAIAYAGWGVPNAAGVVSGQSVFDELKPIVLKLFGDRPGFWPDAVELYFDLHRHDWGVPAGVSWNDWKSNIVAPPSPDSLRAMAPRVVDALYRGAGTGLAVKLPNGGHIINPWGYRVNGVGFLRLDEIDRLVITDNEAAIIGPTVVDVAATGNTLRNLERVFGTAADPVLGKLTADVTEVFAIRNRSDRVHFSQGNRLRLDRYPTSYIVGADGSPIGPNGPLQLSGSDQPLVAKAVVDFLAAMNRRSDAQGITDAPLIGFNGVTLSAEETGWDALRYVPGAGVADQTVGNGIDDLTAFSFSFPRLLSVESATLTLELTPRSIGVTTDELFFPGSRGYDPRHPIGNSLLRSLPVGVTSTVIFDLADMPDGGGSLLFSLRDGEFSVIYGDDAIIHAATLEIVGMLAADVGEPPMLSAMLIVVAFAAASRSRRPVTP